MKYKQLSIFDLMQNDLQQLYNRRALLIQQRDTAMAMDHQQSIAGIDAELSGIQRQINCIQLRTVCNQVKTESVRNT